MSRLAVLLLGPPHIEREGVPIRVDRRKAIALLAYLAVTGKSHRRDALVNLLWPELDSARGRMALRRTLYALRSALDGPWLEVDREEIGLLPGADPAKTEEGNLWVDVVQFRQLLAACETHDHPASQVCATCVSPLAEAVALVRGEFLAGFGLKDSLNFDDWQLFQAEELRRELIGVLDRLVRWHASQREFDPAVGFAKRRLALDPLEEETHRELMRLYAWLGRRSAALRQYEECASVLDDQLGVPPEPATTVLFHAIQAGQVPTGLPAAPQQSVDERSPVEASAPPERLLHLGAGPPFVSEAEGIAEPPVFVAREREMAYLDVCLGDTLAGRGQVVFVTGDAGCGKTALIHAFARSALDAHPDLVFAIGNGNAHTGVGDPYLPFREILGLLSGDVAAPLAAGAMTREEARRLWNLLPLAVQALVRTGPDLIGLFVPGTLLLERAAAVHPWPGDPASLAQLPALAERAPASADLPSMQQTALFGQYVRVLAALASRHPLLLAVDDLQWADGGSLHLLFHLGRHLAGQRILVLCAYRPAEVSLGRPSSSTTGAPVSAQADSGHDLPRGRHPLEPIVNEFKRTFGDIEIDMENIEGRRFVDALLDSEPNKLGPAFREALYRRTRGHPLFTVELLRGMQERGDLLPDAQGQWVEGAELDWETLPARVEAVISERIGRLPEGLRDLLSIASVEGDSFTAEVVAQVQGAGARQVVRSLSDTLDRQHRLVRARGIVRQDRRRLSHYSFRHNLYQKYLYGSLDEVERAYLHEHVGNALEGLCGAREKPAREDEAAGTANAAITAYAPQLARHFEEAGIPEKAIRYLRQAGERALQMAAYEEAIAHLDRGLAMLQTLPGAGGEVRGFERDEEELALQLALGRAWSSTAAPGQGAEEAYTRARELCLQTGQMSRLCGVLGQLALVRYVRAEHGVALELAEENLRLAQSSNDPALVALGHWNMGVVLFALGEYEAAHHHQTEMISFYDPKEHHEHLLLMFTADGGPSAMAYDALSLWCLGYPDQAQERSREALDVARGLGHAFTLADVLCYGRCHLHSMLRDAPALMDSAAELVRLAGEKGFPGWLAHATCYAGEALVMLGRVQEGITQIRQGVAVRRSLATFCDMPGILRSLAQGQVLAAQQQEALNSVAEALALVNETGERHWEPELYRLRAELLLMQGEETEAEASLHKAVEIARRQHARSWELRATTSLARLRKLSGRQEEARRALAAIYGWFTEGFETADLLEARALLDELG